MGIATMTATGGSSHNPAAAKLPAWTRSRSLVFIAALAGAVGAVLPAGPVQAASWAVVPTPNASTGDNELSAIDAIGATDGWAVGTADHSPAQPFRRPVTMRWTGGSWQAVRTPALADDGGLLAVDGTASNIAWAVGWQHVPAGPPGTVGLAPVVERWDGRSWSLVPAPVPADAGPGGALLSGVKTFAADRAWAVGSYSFGSFDRNRTLIERWDGQRWTVTPSPNPDAANNTLSAVDGVSADDVWAVGNMGQDGNGGTTRGLVAHWDGAAWSHVAVPTVLNGRPISPVLADVVAVSSRDVWIVGWAFNFDLFERSPYFLHWDGSTWQHGFVPGMPGGSFSGVTAVSPTQVYAVGTGIARWNGAAWIVEDAPVARMDLADATTTPSGAVWAAGSSKGPGRFDPARTLIVRNG